MEGVDAFLQSIGDLDKMRFTPVHFSLYFALYYLWLKSDKETYVVIARRKVMAIAGFRSIVTYHSKISDLVSMGLIVYMPSFDPFESSKVRLLKLTS